MSNVPESIRATAIEAALHKLDENPALCYCQSYRYEKHDGNPPCDRTRLAQKVVDAILPAVVAQVQADTWDEGFCSGMCDEDVYPTAHENPYREKGLNNE